VRIYIEGALTLSLFYIKTRNYDYGLLRMLINVIFLEYSPCNKLKSNKSNKAEMNGVLLLLTKQKHCYRSAIPKREKPRVFSPALPVGEPSALRKNSMY